MYQWEQTIPIEQWLTVEDIHANRHAFPSSEIRRIFEVKRDVAFKDQERQTIILLRDGTEIKVPDSVDELVTTICGDRDDEE